MDKRAEQRYMTMADAFMKHVMKRVGVTDPSKLQCPREKSDMTPCVARDGSLAVCFSTPSVHSLERALCVGCERVIDNLYKEEMEKALP